MNVGKIKSAYNFSSNWENLHYKVVLDKNVYQPGETVKIDLLSDNSECHMDIKKLSLSLAEVTTL